MFGVAMPQIILNQAQIIPAVGQRVAAAMAQHVRMDVKLQTSPHPGNPDQVVDGRARKLIAALVEKESGHLGIATLRHVAFERPQCIGVERLLG